MTSDISILRQLINSNESMNGKNKGTVILLRAFSSVKCEKGKRTLSNVHCICGQDQYVSILIFYDVNVIPQVREHDLYIA